MSRSFVRFWASIGAFCVIAGGLVSGAQSASAEEPAAKASASLAVTNAVRGDIVQAADLRLFSAGNIISDAVFFASATMNEAQIDQFLRSKVSSCSGGAVCLKDYRQATVAKPADAYCRGYEASPDESAAAIIYKAAQSCGINPQVLLVTLQKEQGLVTATAPNASRYRIAMGFACPDTAACDTRYYGFQNQVYSAARQFNVYARSSYFSWYAPGRTWNIGYHPNSACGSAPVYVSNTATAGLYYYTPYQPNPAALAAGYGTGDGCSSYGNRNFFNYFTDWFGSTQASSIVLARSSDDPAIHLLSDGKKWHVPDGSDYASLASSFGEAQVVSEAYLRLFATQGVTTSVLRDPVSGTMAVVQGGRFHALSTCEQVAQWGASCAAPTTVSAELFARLGDGGTVGSVFRIRGTEEWAAFDGTNGMVVLADERAARSMAQNMAVTPVAPYLSGTRLAALSRNGILFAPGTLVLRPGSDRVYSTVDFNRLAWVTDGALLADYGRGFGDVVRVTEAQLSRYTDSGVVTPTLRCPSGNYMLSEGRLHRLADGSGLATTEAQEVTCAQYPLSDGVINTLAVKSSASDSVYTVQGGTTRRAVDWASLIGAVGQSPRILTVAASTISALPVGAPLASGLIVKASGPEIVLADGAEAHPIPTMARLSELGAARTLIAITDVERAAMSTASPLSNWAVCDGRMMFIAGGGLVHVGTASGYAAVELSTATCERLPKHAGTDRLLVRGQSGSTVYVAEGGGYRPLASWAEATAIGGPQPRIFVVADGSLAELLRG